MWVCILASGHASVRVCGCACVLPCVHAYAYAHVYVGVAVVVCRSDAGNQDALGAKGKQIKI